MEEKSEVEREVTLEEYLNSLEKVQYDGSKNDLDWRKDFRFLNLI